MASGFGFPPPVDKSPAVRSRKGSSRPSSAGAFAGAFNRAPPPGPRSASAGTARRSFADRQQQQHVMMALTDNDTDSPFKKAAKKTLGRKSSRDSRSSQATDEDTQDAQGPSKRPLSKKDKGKDKDKDKDKDKNKRKVKREPDEESEKASDSEGGSLDTSKESDSSKNLRGKKRASATKRGLKAKKDESEMEDSAIKKDSDSPETEESANRRDSDATRDSPETEESAKRRDSGATRDSPETEEPEKRRDSDAKRDPLEPEASAKRRDSAAKKDAPETEASPKKDAAPPSRSLLVADVPPPRAGKTSPPIAEKDEPAAARRGLKTPPAKREAEAQPSHLAPSAAAAAIAVAAAAASKSSDPQGAIAAIEAADPQAATQAASQARDPTAIAAYAAARGLDADALREQTKGGDYPPDFYAFLLFLYHLSPWAALFSHFAPDFSPSVSDLPQQKKTRKRGDGGQGGRCVGAAETSDEDADGAEDDEAANVAAAIVSTMTSATAAAIAAGKTSADGEVPSSTPVALTGVVEARTLPPAVEARSVVQFTQWPGHPLHVARLDPYNQDDARRSFYVLPKSELTEDAHSVKRPMSAPESGARNQSDKKKNKTKSDAAQCPARQPPDCKSAERMHPDTPTSASSLSVSPGSVQSDPEAPDAAAGRQALIVGCQPSKQAATSQECVCSKPDARAGQTASSEQVWCACDVTPIVTSDASAVLRHALQHASAHCNCAEEDEEEDAAGAGADGQALEALRSRMAQCARAVFSSCLPARGAPQGDDAAPARQRRPTEKVTTVAPSPDSLKDSDETGPTGNRVIKLLCCENALLLPETENIEVEILLKKSFHYLEPKKLLEKNTQDLEDIPILDKKSLNEVEGILNKILPKEQFKDSLERRTTIGEGVLELVQKLMLFDKFPEKKTHLLWNLIDSVLKHRELEDAIQSRTELDRQIDVILVSLSEFKDDAYVSDVRPHFKSLMLIIMSAEQFPASDDRLLQRENARDNIKRLINISALESQMKKLQYYDLMKDILEKIFPEYEMYDDSNKISLLQEGIEELANKITFTQNHEKTSFGRISFRRTAVTRQMIIHDFTVKVIPEKNEEIDVTAVSDEILAQIQDLVESIIPSWRTYLSSHYDTTRSNLEQLFWTVFIGRQESDESARSELRETAKEILENILRRADIDSHYKEMTSGVQSILNKIMPEEEVESVNERKDFVRSGMNDIIELINPTVEMDNPYPRSCLLPQKRIQRINTPYLIVPELLDEVFKEEAEMKKSESIKKSSENLIESVIPLAEAEENNFLFTIRDYLRDILNLIGTNKSSQVNDSTLRQSRLLAQNILESIAKNIHNVSERERQELDENVDYILNSILSAGALQSDTQRKTELRSSIGILFETITPSKPLDGSIIRDSIVGRVSLWPRRITLHSDIQKLIDISDYGEGIEGDNIRHSIHRVLDNIAPIESIKFDALLSNLREEGVKLMVILMSFNKCTDDENKKSSLRYSAHVHVDNIINMVHQIRERCAQEDRQEKEDIVSHLMPNVGNIDTFERKCSIRDGIENLLRKIHTNKSRENMMLVAASWQKDNNFLKKSALCNAIEMFVEDLVPDSEDGFTSERRNILSHNIADVVDAAAPPLATGENLALKYFRVDLKNLLQTVVTVQYLKEDYDVDKIRKLVHCRLDIVLRDADVMDMWKRCKTLDEIEYFINALYPKEIENVFEKKSKIRQGIEKLVDKILSNREANVSEMYDERRKMNISADAQKLVEMIIPNEKEKSKIGRNEIDAFTQNFVDIIVSRIDPYNNISLKETRDNLKDILDKIIQAEDAPDFESVEQVRLVARENFEALLLGEEFENEMKRDQVAVDVEDILDKILPQPQMMDKGKVRKAMRRGTNELIKKAVYYKEGDIMILNRRVIPNKKIIKKDLKNIMVMIIPDDDVQDCHERRDKIRVAVSNLSEKVLPLSECQGNLELRKIREKFEELLGSLLPFAPLIYDEQERVELRSAVRQQLRTIVENTNIEDENRKTFVEFQTQRILDKLIPSYDITDDTERKGMLTEGIEDLIEKIRSTINQEHYSSCKNITPRASEGMDGTSLHEEIEKLISLATSKSAKTDSPKELQIRFSTQELVDIYLLVEGRKDNSDIFKLRENTRNLLVGVVSNFAEQNLEKGSSVRADALESLRAIIRASESYYLERRERISGEVVEILDKMIPFNYLGDTSGRSLRDGIQELFEKIIPSTETDKIDRLPSEVDTFVGQILNIDGVEVSQRWSEVNRYVSQLIYNFFAPEGCVETVRLADDLEELLEDFVAVAQVEMCPSSRSELRCRAQLILERIIMSTREERPQHYNASNTVYTYFALHEPRPILLSQTLVDHSLTFDIKRRSFFGIFPWIGKKLSRNSKSKFKEKSDGDGKVTKSRKKSNEKRNI